MIRVLIDKQRILFSEVWDGVDHITNTKTRGSKYQNALRTFIHWRASVASETLTGLKMKKSGMFVYWRASEASETVLGVDNAKLGICYIYICMYVWMVRMLFKCARGELFSPKNTAI